MAAQNARSFAFGPFVLVPERQLLERGGVAVRIGGRALDILTVLVERPGEVVGKRELMARVWPETLVEEGNLKVNMAMLRRVLGGASDGSPYIATVVGRGYRFTAPVRSVGADVSLPIQADGQRRHNLPTATMRIVGRDEAIAKLLRDLDDARLVSIVGPGGIGKTTVAVAAAEQVVGAYRDGVWLVDLSPLRDAALVPNAIATAIGLAAHSANMLAALTGFLRSREILLLLDSCEHMLDGIAATADRLLTDAPGVKILATSREPLRLKGERVRRLPGLATPPEAGASDAAAALAYPAVQLFVDRASDRLDTFRLGDGEAPLVAEICRRLDGLALAIELAATRVDTVGIAGVLAQLDQCFRLLQGLRGGAERHRTLTATIDWSYGLLTDGERALLRRLAAFAGSFDLAAAAAVTGDAVAGRDAVTDGIAGLVAKSLLAAEMRDAAVAYRMLDTTRAYALEKLVEHGELDDARRRHAAWCLDLVDRGRDEVERLTRPDWLARYGAKVNDVREALRWAFTDVAPPGLGVRLTVAAIPFGRQVSLVEECRLVVERALDDRFRAHRSTRDDLILNLTHAETLLHTRGPLPQVKASLTLALTLAEELADREMQIACLRGLSEYELWTGDSHAAIDVAKKISALETVDRSPAAGDADGQAGSAMSWLGALAAARHQLEEIVRRPLGHNRRADTVRFEFDQRLTAAGTLATVLWLQGFPDQAVALARRQLAEAEASHYAVSLCYALLHGSLVVSLYVRDYDAAAAYLARGLDHATKHGLSIWRAMGGSTRTRLNLYTGRPIDLAACREALAEVRDGGFRMRYPNYLTNYGEALARQGDLAGGLAAIDEAMAISESRGQVVGIPEMLRIRGNVLRFQDLGRLDEAAACYRRSIELARRDYALSWELRSATSLVKLGRTRGGDGEAEDMLAAAYERFEEGFSTGDLRRARALIDTRPRD